MSKYKIIFDGTEEDDVFDTYEEADDYALYLVSCTRLGGQILEMSNPGDNPYDPDDEPEYDIIEVLWDSGRRRETCWSFAHWEQAVPCRWRTGHFPPFMSG